LDTIEPQLKHDPRVLLAIIGIRKRERWILSPFNNDQKRCKVFLTLLIWLSLSSESLRLAGVYQNVNLVSGFSPQAVEELANKTKKKWSLFFIDGNHNDDYPLKVHLF
jgi:hypothetical protein